MSDKYTIDSVGEYLEDSMKGRYARYSVENDSEGADSVWICLYCDHDHEHCICTDGEEMLGEDPVFY